LIEILTDVFGQEAEDQIAVLLKQGILAIPRLRDR
jgi:hypothetical protein